MTIAHDNQVTLDFLKRQCPGGPWLLTAIQVDPDEGKKKKTISNRSFQPADNLGKWLDDYARKRNLYFHLNPRIDEKNRRAKREDIKEVVWLGVDIDPRAGEDLKEEQDRALELLTTKLPPGVPPPTIIIFSGGGYQGFWRLSEPIEIGGDIGKAEDAKLYNIALELAFGADNCHSIEHIFRLPGTINCPDETKRKKGRTSTLATLVEFNDNEYDLDQFKKAPAPLTEAEVSDAPAAAAALGDLELNKRGLGELARNVIIHGTDPNDPNRWGGDRSDAVFFVACEMVRVGFENAEIAAILLDPNRKISQHVLAQGNSTKYAGDQARNARDDVNNTLTRDSDGIPYKTQRNVRLSIRMTGAKLAYNEFTDRLEIKGFEGYGPELTDEAVTAMWLRIDDRLGLRPHKSFFQDIAFDLCRQYAYNPLTDYLNRCEENWDGKPRVDDWLSTYCNATASDYMRAVGKLFMIAAVRRARHPGCKFDEMMVMFSEVQGVGKSSALAALCHDPDWFLDDLPMDATTKVLIEQVEGKWIVEVAELVGMSAKKQEHSKAMLSRCRDRARMAYGRLSKTVPRAFVIAGTTNTGNFLDDPTGNRRYWPTDTDKIDLDGLVRDRDQLWGEAATRERAGESIRLDPSLYKDAGEKQDEYSIENPFIGPIAACLGNIQGKIRSSDIWNILNLKPGASQTNNSYYGKACKALGWTKKKGLSFNGVASPSTYVRGPEPWAPILIDRNRNGTWFVTQECRAPRAAPAVQLGLDDFDARYPSEGSNGKEGVGVNHE